MIEKNASTNWARGIQKPFNRVIDRPREPQREIQYTGSNGKRESVFVGLDRVEAKVKSLAEQGRKPILIP